jgi:hypothetical protein
MKTKRKPWMTCLGLLLASCLGIYILLALYWFPYERFKKESLAAVPKFDALNETVLEELPLPQGAVEVEKHSWGIKYPDSTRYDRELEVYYTVVNSAGVLDIYKNYFISHGWKDINPKHESSTTIGYYLGTACVGVGFPFSDEPDRYLVSISHDFLNQNFSPKIPKLPNIGKYNLLEIYEGLKFSVGTCPHRQLDLFGTE